MGRKITINSKELH